MVTTFLPAFAELLLSSLLLSAVLSGVLVWSKRWHGRYTFDQVDGIQRMHTNRVPRIGGLAIFTTLIVINGWFSVIASNTLISTMLIMGSFIFTFGFLEDITKKVGVALRMWASLLPGFIAYMLTDEYLVSLDFAWLDAILVILPIGLIFTTIAISGMTHAINFLDGLNGLSVMTSLWILTGLATLAVINSSTPELVPILILIAALIGFLMWNWPFGKLFLGDGGAYLIGMCLAWLAISLSIHNPSITSWSMLLLCAYPITEVLYSIYRRITTRRSSGNPDRAHLHQLIASVWIYPKFQTIPLVMRNSLSGAVASLMNLPVLLATIVLYQNKWACIAAYGLFVITYIALYRTLIKQMSVSQQVLKHQAVGGGLK